MAFNKNRVMDSARKFVEKGQTDRAIKEYLRVVQEDPKDVRVWLKIGDLYAKRGAKQEATETYVKVAKFYGEQGFYLKAVAVYKQILKLDPRLVEINLKLAELYRQLGLLSDAMQHFEMVAAFFHREGKTKEALATIRQLVDLDPENVATRIKLAELYSKEGMRDEAVTEFGQVCDYLRSHNRQDDFVKVAERLLWHQPDNQAMNRELATLYLRRNDPRRALQKLQVCFKADPRDVETLALLAQAFQALEQKSKTVSVLKELARVLSENGQVAQAREVHRKVLMFVPDDPDSRAAVGESRPVAAPAPEVVRDVPREVAPRRPLLTTSEMQAYVPSTRKTGSMPLVADSPRARAFAAATGIETTGRDDDLAADIALEDDSGLEAVSSVTGEVHADEIVKILTETDVYVKYGLQQKAIDHLRRVFELDPGNLEARERLKDILFSMGREVEGVRELFSLAQQTAIADPERSSGYVREILAVEPGHAGALDLVRQHRLALDDVSGGVIVDEESGSIELSADDLGSGQVAAVEDDIDFDDIDFPDDDVQFATDQVSPRAVGSPVPDARSRVAMMPPGGALRAAAPLRGPAPPEDADFEFELDDLDVAAATPTPVPARRAEDRSGVTMEVAADQVADELSLVESSGEDLDFDSAIVDVAPAGPGAGDDAHAFGADPVADAAGYAADFELPDELRVARPIRTDYQHHEDTAQAPPMAMVGALHEHTLEAEAAYEGGDLLDQSSGTSLEDDLDEADFFVTQGLYGEATDILQGLLGRYPNHPLVVAKLQDVAAMAAAGHPPAPVAPPPEPVPAPAAPAYAAPARAPSVTVPSPPVAGEHTPDTLQPRPAVLLEKPLDDEDADTHYDLGLAYKEMGLHDEAIKAFAKVVNVPGRAIKCYLMIGLCHREKGNLSEAVHQFKAGLYVDNITDREKYGLYYEIGGAYEDMDDPSEALYYFEMVYKKDARYRDVAARIEGLRGRAARARRDAGRDDSDPGYEPYGEKDVSQH